MKKRFCLLMALVLTVSCLSGATFAATVIATVDTPGSSVVNVTDASEIATAVSASGFSVITLKTDITAHGIILPYSCIVNLAGHTVTSTGDSALTIASAGQQNRITYIKNGVIDGKALGIQINAGGLNMKNVIVRGGTSAAVGICETATAYNDLNRIEDCTLVSLANAALSFHDQNGKQRGVACSLKNSTLIAARPAGSSPSPVVDAQGENTGAVTLEEGVRIYHCTPLYRAADNKAQNDHDWRGENVETLGLTARAEHRFTDLSIPELSLTLEGLDSWHSYSQPEGTDVETLQRAVVETALAYYRKGRLVQYDWAAMTWQQRLSLGVSRMNTGAAPEDAAYDFTVNTNCSDWICDVYLNAFDYAPTGSRRHNQVRYFIKNKRDTDGDVIFRYYANQGDKMPQEVKDQIPGLRDLLQPGDLINVMVPAGGHTMMYIGDYKGDGKEYYIHSGGGGTPVESGKDTLHANGTISISNVDRLFDPVNPSSFSPLGKTVYQFSVVRPVNLLSESDLTPSALSRLQYPGLDIDRSSDAPLYSSVETGRHITVTLTLKNTGGKDITGLPVTENLPTGAELVKTSVTDGGTVSAAGIGWTVSMGAGETKRLSYRVKVTADPGQTVTLPGGTVADIPTRILTNTVLGSPLATKQEIYDTVTSLDGYTVGGTGFANDFYKNVLGADLELPSMDDIIQNLFTQEAQAEVSNTGGNMLVARNRSSLTAQYQRIYDMLLPDHQAGQSVYIPVNPECGRPEGRVSTYLKSNYMPGDIILGTGGTSYLSVNSINDVVVYIYLGGDRVAAWDSVKNAGGVPTDTTMFQILSFDESIARSLRLNVMLCLRPALLEDLDIEIDASILRQPDILWQHGGETVECNSLRHAASLITQDGLSTITLFADIIAENDVALTAPYSFTLDLGGHTIHSPNYNAVVVENAGTKCSVTTVKNGTLRGKPIALRVNGGGVHVVDATLFSTGGAALCLYTVTAEFNESNLVERSRILSDTYFALSFNRNDTHQEAVSITIRDSDLITTKSGTAVLGTRNPSAQSGTVVLGTGVNLYGCAADYAVGKVTVTGEDVTAQAEKAVISLPHLELSAENLNHWKTLDTPPAPEEPEVSDVPETPEEPEVSDVPETPEVSEVPETPETPKASEAPKAPETSQEEKGAPVGLIVGIVAVIVPAAVVLVLLKKKKK